MTTINPHIPTHLVLKRIGKLIILCTTTSIKLITVEPSHNQLHRLIHRYEASSTNPTDNADLTGERSSSSLIRSLLRNPLDALRLPGPRKINLLILLALREYAEMPTLFSSVFSAILNPNSKKMGLGRGQKQILRLLMLERKHLDRLLVHSPSDFLDFMTIFHDGDFTGALDDRCDGTLDDTTTSSTESTSSSSSAAVDSVAHASSSSSTAVGTQTSSSRSAATGNVTETTPFRRELDVLHDCKRAELGYTGFKTTEMRIHRDFCVKDTESPAIVSNDYQMMIEHIKRNRIFHTIVRGSSFYPEVALYNSFLLSRIGDGCFDPGLFDREFKTTNEKLVRSYVSKRTTRQRKRR